MVQLAQETLTAPGHTGSQIARGAIIGLLNAFAAQIASIVVASMPWRPARLKMIVLVVYLMVVTPGLYILFLSVSLQLRLLIVVPGAAIAFVRLCVDLEKRWRRRGGETAAE